jgi:putative phosphoribosyl transferase
VPVGFEVAQALGAPLDVFLVRKLGVPGHEELAMGAIATGGVRLLNDDVVRRLRIPPEVIDAVTAVERAELERRERAYRGDRPAPPARDRVGILVDDGLATGASMRAALRAVRAQEPAAVVVGVPVGSPETCRALRGEADEVVCIRMPDRFLAVGQAYVDFSPTTDAEVRAVLDAFAPVSIKSPHRH